MYKYGPSIGFIAFLLAFALYHCFYIVPEGRQAVVLKFGQVVGDPKTEAGLYFKIPYYEARLMEKRVLNWDGRAEEGGMPTLEKKNIVVDTTARWQIEDPVKFIKSLRSVREAQPKIKSWIDSATREIISRNNLIETVRSTNELIRKVSDTRTPKRKEASAESAEAKEDLIEQIVEQEIVTDLEQVTQGRRALTEAIQELARPQMQARGIKIIDVQLKRVALVPEVEQQVFTRMITERKRIAEKIRSIGKGEQAKIRGRTNRELQEIESEAYRREQEIKGNAEAKAIRIYADAMEEDPKFYEFIRTIEAYQNGLRSDAKLILSANADFLELLRNGPNTK